jgi:subtilisin family serine protease
VLVANHSAGDPTAMGVGASPDGVQPTIPAYMVSFDAGQAIKTLTGASTTIDKDLAYFNTANDDIQASFSSQGPTDVDFRVKPDVMAPGVNVLSSIPASHCTTPPCFAFFQGTSMATPHLAGAAAVVRGQHPGWAAWQVRSAVVNTAERGIVTSSLDGTTVLTDPNIIGAGRLNLANAVSADAALSPVSVSFGAIPSGAGRSGSAAVILTNVSGAPATWSLSVTTASGTGVGYSVSPSSVTLANGASTTITVTITAAKGSSFGDHQAWLNIGTGGAAAHAAIYSLVK